MAAQTPSIRISLYEERPPNPSAEFVLYWMPAFHRVEWNFSLQRSVEWAMELGKPLVIVEDLRCDRRWDSDRSHLFALQGMASNARKLARKPVRYYPFVEREPGEAEKLLEALAQHASVIVTDEYPLNETRAAVRSLASKVKVRLELVDSNGLLPLRAARRVFATAFSFRRFLQKELPHHLVDFPRPDPLAGASLRVM
ncbi:MAG: deoxyribodipyrimidine photolyase, partial [Armatimonadota bacterium]